MVKVSEQPDGLRPYLFHGLDLDWSGSDKNAMGQCPFCDDDGAHFSVEVSTGKYQCWRCTEGKGSGKGTGNAYIFIRELWAMSDKETKNYMRLAEDRKLEPDTLIHWNVVQSVLTREWLIPGYNVKGSLCQLYKYTRTAKGMRLLPTPLKIVGGGHQLHGVNLYKADREIVILCEGPWDAMSIWEVLGTTKMVEDKLLRTANANSSLLANTNVLATPGASVFFPVWTPLFAGKTVNLLYDNDHPKGKQSKSPGDLGMKRVAGVLTTSAHPPAKISYIDWEKHCD